MKLLIDTNILIWSVSNSDQLVPNDRRLIQADHVELIVSIVSLWECSIKMSKGTLTTVGTSIRYLIDELQAQDVELLPVQTSHLLMLEQLPHLHRDPFDRLIIAQALAENLAVVTADRIFADYGVTIAT